MSESLAKKIGEWQKNWPADFSKSDIPAGKPLIIYGAGGFGRKACSVLKKNGFTIAAFIDQRAVQLKTVEGIPCHTLDNAIALLGEHTVVIGVFNFAVSVHRLSNELKSRGARLITPLQLIEAFPADFGWQFWMAPRSFYRSHLDQIQRVNELWADDASRACYLNALKMRIDHDWSALDQPDAAHQYFPQNLPRWPEPINFVDGGSFTGDTIQSFLDNGYKVNRVFAFEPDAKNIAALKQRAQQNFPTLNLAVLPKGLGAKAETVEFSANQGGASHIGQGTEKIQIVPLDDALPNESINLIKLDIEGAEPAALLGMKNTIARCKPGLAVCVYHQPDHLFSIAESLHKDHPGYRFHLRPHQFTGFDTVLYAI